MQPSSKQVVVDLIRELNPTELLDCPSGGGWLQRALSDAGSPIALDGIDLYADTASPYRRLIACDLDLGLPDELPSYPLIVSCEGIEHFGNPELFLRSVFNHLPDGGHFLVTTPNVWYPASKLQYLLRGFFPSFPSLAGKIRKGSHMHISPWSFAQLYLYLRLAGFEDVRLHAEPLSKAKHGWERLLGKPQQWYCQRKRRKAQSEEERDFWRQAGSKGSVYGRHLIVTARRPG